MKLTRMTTRAIECAAGAARRAPSVIKAARAAKHKYLLPAGLLAGAGVFALAGAAHAAGPSGVWHVPPDPEVRAICHAGDTLWVGTSAGLFRVDVRNASRIDRIDAGPSLPSPSVRGIVAKGDSVLVATDGGIALFRGSDVSVFTPHDPGALAGVPLERLTSIAVGNRNEVLIGSRGLGAGVLTASGGYTLTRRDSLLDDIVYDVADVPGGARYFGSLAGLCAQLEDTTFAWYQAGAGIPRGEVRHIAAGPDGGLYVLVSRLGIFRFDGARAVGMPSSALPLRDALSISAAPDGALWACGDGWVAVHRGRSWTRQDIAAPDSTARWRTVVADGAGAFVGSDRGVVLAIGRGSALRVDLGGGLPAGRVESIAPDGNGRAWLVSGGHVLLADARASNTTLESKTSDATCVALTRDGVPVVAGRWTVRRRDAGGWTDLAPDVVEADPAYTSATVDADGRVWVGMRSGALYRFDGEIWLRMARGRGPDSGVSGVFDVRTARGGAWALVAGLPVRSVADGLDRYAGVDSTEGAVDLERSPSGEWVAVTPKHLYRFDEAARRWERVDAATLAGAPAGKRKRIERPGRLTAIAFDARGRVFLGATGGVGIVDATGERWCRVDGGVGGRDVTSLAVDGERLWIGFATDGLSVVPLQSTW